MILNQKIGLLFGYPQTAVKAFKSIVMTEKELKRKIMLKGLQRALLDKETWHKDLSDKEKKDLLEEKVLKFTYFMPSKENWQEELEVVRKWQKIIKDKSPNLYQERLKESSFWEEQILKTLRDDNKK